MVIDPNNFLHLNDFTELDPTQEPLWRLYLPKVGWVEIDLDGRSGPCIVSVYKVCTNEGEPAIGMLELSEYDRLRLTDIWLAYLQENKDNL